MYPGDRYFKGLMRDVRLYNRALPAVDIAALPANATAIRSVALPALATRARQVHAEKFTLA